jgi:hypothetical protein
VLNLPSNTILLLDGATLFLEENANDNLIRNANPFNGGNSNIHNTNIRGVARNVSLTKISNPDRLVKDMPDLTIEWQGTGKRE